MIFIEDRQDNKYQIKLFVTDLIIIMLKNILTTSLRRITNSRNSDTIYALATGVNNAVSIVRVGGNFAFRTLQLLSKQPQNQVPSSIRSEMLSHYKIQDRKAHLKRIYNSEGNIIDECILLYFPPSHSYNNEEIVQLHVHGSRAVVASIFKQLKQKGFRMADRGEFTKRALLNGKINIVKAESINDLIKSQTEFERRIAINNMLGKSKQFLEGIKKELIKCLANNQAYIDFQDDEKDVREDLIDVTKQKVQQILKRIRKIMENYKNLQIIKQGIDVTIMGKPNAGKSTLINALAQKQVAIVSQEPGTTRDILQTQIECGGVMLNLYDTAGLRDTQNKIQIEGIKRAKLKMKQSQINLLLIDIEQEQVRKVVNEKGQTEREIFNDKFQEKLNLNYNQIIDDKTIIVVNKSDKLKDSQQNSQKYFMKIKKTKQSTGQTVGQLIQQKKYVDQIISSQNQSSVSKFLEFLSIKVQKQFSLYENSQQIYFTRERYFLKLETCSQLLGKYIEQHRSDIACQYLRFAIEQISEIFGKVDVEDVLDVLFQEFCIGK